MLTSRKITKSLDKVASWALLGVVNFAPRVAGPVAQLCFDGSRRLEGANRLERGLGDEVSNFKYRKLVEA